MKKFFTKPIITILLIIYCLVNFATFSSASVCVAKDHVGLNMFGIDACCIARHQVAITDRGQVALTAEDCSDQSISANCNEIIPDSNVPMCFSDCSMDYFFLDFVNFDVIHFEKRNLYYNQARSPDINYPDRLRTVILTI